MLKPLKILFLVPYAKELYLRDYFCTSISKAGYYWQPIDFLVLSGKLKKNNEIFVLDIPLERLSFNKGLKKTKSFNADVIIFLSGSLCSKEDFEFVEKIKTPTTKIFGIGETFLDNPQAILQNYTFIDGIILDFTHSYINEFILSQEKFNNILWPENKKNFSYPVPLYEKFKLKKYNYPFNYHKIYASVLTSYGCPYKCSFCNSGSLGFKLRDIDNIMEEISYVRRNLGIKQIFIKDMTFAAVNTHCLDFLKELSKLKLDIVWNCYSRVDVLNEEIIYWMKKTGCYLVQVGIEHIDETILQNVSKPIKQEDVIKTVNLLKRYKILVGTHFLFGLPSETIDMVKRTIKFVFELKPDYVSFNIFTPRKGSYLSNLVIKENKFLKKIVSKAYLKYYFSFKYLLNRILTLKSLYQLENEIYFGLNLMKNLLYKNNHLM